MQIQATETEANEFMELHLAHLIEKWPELTWSYEDSQRRTEFYATDSTNTIMVAINYYSARRKNPAHWKASIGFNDGYSSKAIADSIYGLTPVEAFENAIAVKNERVKAMQALNRK